MGTNCRATEMRRRGDRFTLGDGTARILGLLVVLSVAMALPAAAQVPVPGPGEEGHPCFNDTNCLDANACTQNVCVIPPVVVARGPNGEPGVCTFLLPAPAG